MTGPRAGTGDSTSALFAALLDDAAIFPPGDAPLAEAVPAHRAWLRSPYAATVGVFVCGAPRLDELAALGADFPVSVTFPQGPGGRDGLDRLDDVLARADVDVAAVEVPHDPAAWDALVAAAVHVPVHVEVPLPDLTTDLARRLATAGLRLKLRTGGAEAAMFPPATALAEGIRTAVAAGLPFKLTAGLHHAVRHRDPATGFEHHGFGNVLAATAAALAGAATADVAAMLDTTDAPTIVGRLRGLSGQEVSAVRGQFLSFGTCSIQEPLDDLTGLGLLPRREVRA